MRITVELTKEEAAALLQFLRRKTLFEAGTTTLEKASEKVRIALRDELEPGWADKDLRDLVKQ
jgi:hypothetical protein